MRYLTILVFFILACTSTVHSQNEQVTRQQLTDLANRKGVIRTRIVTKYQGTPYFNDWSKGHVIISENHITEPILIRYDMEYDAVVFSRDKKIYTISNDKMRGFVLYTTDGDINFRNGFNTDIKAIGQNTLLRIIYDGETKLVAHHTSDLQENLPTYGTANKVSAFEDDVDFYLVTEDGEFNKIRLRKNDVLNILADNGQKVSEYANSNNLKFDNENHLKQILSYYDSL